MKGVGFSVLFPLNCAVHVRQALQEINVLNLIGLYRAEYDGNWLRVTPFL